MLNATKLSVALILFSTPLAHADTFDKRFFADAGISTLGLSGQAGFYFTKNIAVRGQVNTLEFDVDDIDISSLKASGDIKGTTVGLIGDIHIMDSGFFLSGGAYYTDIAADASAPVTVSGSVDINGTTYTAADIASVQGSVEYDKFSPYAGLGYRKAFNNGLHIGFNAGILSVGKPKFSLDADILNTTLETAIQTDLSAELADFQAEFESEVSKLNIVPVVRFSVGYSF